MELSDTLDSVQSADASWIQAEEQDDSIHKLQSLDPQKREKLEARFLGRIVDGLEVSPATQTKSSRKRIFSEDENSKQGISKQAKVDGCRKIDEFFGQSSLPKQVNSSTQTHLTLSDVRELEECVESTQEVLRLKQHNTELEQSVSISQEKLDTTTARVTKCSLVTKDLLIKKCITEQKQARQASVQNQLRLGRFNNQRKGAHFVEVWVDGYAFTDLSQRQSEVTQQREEIEKQRKLLRKVSVSVAPSGGGGARGRGKPDDGFAKLSNPSMTTVDIMEKEEVLKLRSAALKKEETTLQGELENLERERNLHVRELKRVAAEDSSRFNTHPTLHSRYLLLHMIGRGGFSEVYKAFDLQEFCYVACKIHQLNSDWREDKKANYIKHALREYNIHKKLDNPHIVRLFDVFEIDSNSFCTVLEHVDGQDLDFLLKQNRTLPEKEVRTIIIQTMAALKYLNEIRPPVIHFDLKPGNILLGTGVHSFEAKITDFGLSKIMESDSGPDGMELTSQGAGTYWYLPPECFVVGKDPPKISSKVDVWSVGVIFYQCLYGKKPFGHNLSQASILEQNVILRATDVDFPPKPPVGSDAKNFILRCLSYNKECRPDVLSLCDDGYLKPKKQQQVTGQNPSIGL